MKFHQWDNASAPRTTAVGRLCIYCKQREYEAGALCTGVPKKEDTMSEDQKRHSRFDYTTFSPAAQRVNMAITEKAKELEVLLNELPMCREASLSLTDLESSIMWARKAMRDVK